MEYRDIKGVMRYSTGLFLYDPATGRGKSHAARKLLYENSKKGIGKQIFVTNNIKNLSVDEMRKLFQKDGREEAFHQDVLHIKSNIDFVIGNLPKITADYPEEYQTDQYKKILSKIYEYNSENVQNKKEIEEYLMNELEPKFRMELKRLIRNSLPKKLEERQRVINEDEKWSWLSRLYPTVKIWNYKIFIMTVKKFIQVVDPIIDANFIFMNSDFTEDATIVIDEFDETKQVLLEDIIDFAIKSKIDLLGSFRRIYNALTNPRYISILQKYDSKLDNSFLENRGEKFPSLIEEVKQLYSDFLLDLFYKTVDSISDSYKVVFFDGDHHFSYDADNNLTSGVLNEVEDRIDLSFVSKEEYKISVEKGIQMKPLRMISALYEFIEKFKFVVEQWAYQLRTETNDRRNLNDDRMTRQQSIESMFRLFGFDDEVIKKLVNRKVDQTLRKRKRFFDETTITMQWYEYVDSDSSYFETMIQLLRIEDLPETSIISLAKRSRVIGLSATALTPTVLGNYDLRKIQNHLGDSYHVAFEENSLISEETKKNYQVLNKMYQEKKIGFEIYSFDKFHDLSFSSKKIKKIITKYSAVSTTNNQESLREISHSIKTDIDNLMGKIEKEDTTYYCDRYVELIESFCVFITSRSHHSILALQNALPKENKWEFEEAFIRKTFNTLADYYSNTADIYILRSEGFDKDKKELLSRLSNGEKIYILTSYATTGAGQNLQYEISEPSEIINISSSRNEKSFNAMMKDIDGIYLGNITYLLSYLNFDVNEETLNKQILYLLVEIEYLFSNGEITRLYKNKVIDSILKIYASRQPKSLKSSGLSNTLSVKLKATKLVIQAVGRITRTQNKAQNIMLLISQSLLEHISDEGLNFEMLTPEMNAILSYKKDRKMKPLESIELQRNRRNNLVINNAKKYIDKLLISIRKSEKAREDWRNLRLQLLKDPTIDHLPEGDLADAYIEVPEGKRKKYFYAVDKTQYYYFGSTKDEVRTSIPDNMKPLTIYEVSEESAGLNQLLVYPSMKDYFSQQKIATKFKEKQYMINPIFFQQILKGAYGEFAGKHVVEMELGILLREIKTDEAFELFDYRDDQGNYYDFKNWRETSNFLSDITRDKIRKKFYKVGGESAWIINLIKPSSDLNFKMTPDKKIIEIPWLIDSNGDSKLREWVSEIWREINE